MSYWDPPTPDDPWISTPEAGAGERWFHSLDPEHGEEGIWHLGPVAWSKTLLKGWPAGPGRCGYAQPDIAVGRHETAASTGTKTSNICPICLAALRADYERARAR
jgi:hypothetical protein